MIIQIHEYAKFMAILFDTKSIDNSTFLRVNSSLFSYYKICKIFLFLCRFVLSRLRKYLVPSYFVFRNETTFYFLKRNIFSATLIKNKQVNRAFNALQWSGAEYKWNRNVKGMHEIFSSFHQFVKFDAGSDGDSSLICILWK